MNPGEEFILVAATDGGYMRTLDRPKVIDGRLPVRADEVALSEAAVEELDLRPGGRLTLDTLTQSQLERLVFEGDNSVLKDGPAGPAVPLRVVGVLRTRESVAEVGSRMVAFANEAFWQAHAGSVGAFPPELLVRLRDGQAGVERFTAAAKRLAGEEGELIVRPLREDVDKVEATLDVQALALLLFAACAGVAGMAATAVATHRQLVLSGRDQPVLSALGLHRGGRVISLTSVSVPAVVAGSVGGLALAVAASPLFPRDVARKVEPAPGVDVDMLVLGTGTVGLLAVTVAFAVLAALRLSSRASDPGDAGGGRPSAVAGALARLPASPSLVTGARMALERGSGGNALPVRQALAGAAAGVCGVVGVLTFGASLDRLVATPALFGFPWDAEVAGGEEEESISGMVASLVADRRVEDVVVARITSAIEVEGRDVQAYGAESRKGERFLTIVDGRAPADADEVALGTGTIENLGTDIGRPVRVRVGEEVRSLRVVGTALFPVIDNDRYREGAAFTLEGLEAFPLEGGFYDALVNWAPGVDKAAARAELEERTGFLFPIDAPPEITNLRSVEELPTVLAVFLAVLGLASAAHALATSVRRRRTELAVLRALGFVRGQVRLAVMAQASTIASVAVVVGAPLGLALGSWAWNLLARELGVPAGADPSVAAVVLASAATVVAVNALAVLPARAAARRATATALRTE